MSESNVQTRNFALATNWGYAENVQNTKTISWSDYSSKLRRVRKKQSLFIPTSRNATCALTRSLLPKTDVTILFQHQWHYVCCSPLLPSKGEYADETPDITPQAVDTDPTLTRPNVGSKIEESDTKNRKNRIRENRKGKKIIWMHNTET